MCIFKFVAIISAFNKWKKKKRYRNVANIHRRNLMLFSWTLEILYQFNILFVLHIKLNYPKHYSNFLHQFENCLLFSVEFLINDKKTKRNTFDWKFSSFEESTRKSKREESARIFQAKQWFWTVHFESYSFCFVSGEIAELKLLKKSVSCSFWHVFLYWLLWLF